MWVRASSDSTLPSFFWPRPASVGLESSQQSQVSSNGLPVGQSLGTGDLPGTEPESTEYLGKMGQGDDAGLRFVQDRNFAAGSV